MAWEELLFSSPLRTYRVRTRTWRSEKLMCSRCWKGGGIICVTRGRVVVES